LYGFRLKSSLHCLSSPCVLEVRDCHITVLWRLLLCNFLQPCATFVALCQNILLNTFSSNTITLSSFLRLIILKSLASANFVRLSHHITYVVRS
jgi:hypothetical protein